MPRARDPKRKEAYTMWLASGKHMKLCDIAAKLGIPEVTVRAWKNKDSWANTSKKNEGNVPKNKRNAKADKRNVPKRKSGGQPGNHNGKGKGQPPGNICAVKHGAYMRIYGNLLTDEEKEIVPELFEQDERTRLENLYAAHQIKERQLLKYIKDIETGAEMITHRVTRLYKPVPDEYGNSESEAATDKKSEEFVKVVKISQESETRNEQLRNFTDALTRVRAEMRRVADSLRMLSDSEAKNKTVIGSVGDSPVQIYLPNKEEIE